MNDKLTTDLQTAVVEVLEGEKKLEAAKSALQLNPEFKKFLEMEKKFRETATDVWKTVEDQMIEHDIKQLKGDFGTITIAERLNWSTTDELPTKFYKKVVDTKRISDTFRLEGKAPKGATPSYTKYITKRLK